MRRAVTSLMERFIPTPPEASATSAPVTLRSGTSAWIRPSEPLDREQMGAFFASLSEEARFQRFQSPGQVAPLLIDRFCDNRDPGRQLTLVALRLTGKERIIATGSYFVESPGTAEVAFAVSGEFQGEGLATQLLERLARMAIANGIRDFWATTRADNVPMIDVFTGSGFGCHVTMAKGQAEVLLRLTPTANSVSAIDERDQVTIAASLIPFFKPSSIAIVGASRRESSVGYRVLACLKSSFAGPIHPVNPSADAIQGLTCYPSTDVIPVPVDLAVVAVPGDCVMDAVDRCRRKGVRALIVLSAGFGETGPAGLAIERQLAETVRRAGMRMIGPNCLGLMNADPSARLNATFSPVPLIPGHIAMASQSGAVGLAILEAARRTGLGISSFVSIGNRADVSSNDLLQYWESDPTTRVILLYLESLGNPRRFSRIARRVGRTKPIVVLKSGRSTVGQRAAASHTAALAGHDGAVDGLLRQSGVVRAESIDGMFAAARVLSMTERPEGNRVAILTNAGGPAILCADAAESHGLTVAPMASATRQRLEKLLPSTASVQNPVDMIASAGPDTYRAVIPVVMADPGIDTVIVMHTVIDPSLEVETLAGIEAGIADARTAGLRKPVLLSLLASTNDRHELTVGTERIPVFTSPESAAVALAPAVGYARWCSAPPGRFPDFPDLRIPEARQAVRSAMQTPQSRWLSPAEVRALLEAFGIRQIEGRTAGSGEEAAAVATDVGFPVAIKLDSDTITHKSDIGGVHLGIRSAEEARSAFHSIERRLGESGRRHDMKGVLIQPMMNGHVEVMIGMTEDPGMGAIIAFGLGGIHVEVLRDTAFRVAPLTDRDARHMVAEIRGRRLLEGFRGHPPADIAALEDMVLRVSRLAEELPEVIEMDLNPVFAGPPGTGAIVGDARIRVASGKEPGL